MKYLLSVIVAAMLLSACGTTTPGEIDAKIEQVQTQTAAVCRFVPTVTTVAKILATFAGAVNIVDVVGQAANGICEAITTAPLAEGPGEPGARYRGVTIEGRQL